MPDREVVVSIVSNNSELEKDFLDKKLHPEVRFVKNSNSLPYQIFLIDLETDISHISQTLIETYGHCRTNEAKLAVIILHGKTIDIEKNHYFQKMLDDLGKDKPLHRLIFTKDIYQSFVETPATPLDNLLYSAITKRSLTISRKGEDLFFPLSLEDFVNATVKTLFLSSTAGKVFWLLGDSFTDLEVSYLLKQNISDKTHDEMEINATENNDPKTNSLLSISNKTRAELNWQPEDEFVDDLKKIFELYSDRPIIKEEKPEKHNILHQFLTWIYRPRGEARSNLPTFKKIVSRLLVAILSIYILVGGVFTLVTGISLKKLQISVDQTLNGELNKSVASLESSQKYQQIGESILATIVPVMNIFSPKGTEKIFNLYQFIDYSRSSLENLHQTYVMAEKMLLSLNNNENKINYADYSLALHSNLSQVYENLNQIAFLTKDNKLPTFLGNKLSKNPEFKNLKTLEDQVVEYIRVVDIIPGMFSGDRAKQIFILLQNSQVTKPLGGEIDYYLLLTLDGGRLISKKYYTDDELNKLYQSFVTSSPKSSKSIPISNLKLSSIIQNPDFTASSFNTSIFLDKAIKVKPDFIIATNDQLLKELLTEEKSPDADSFTANIEASSGSVFYKDLFDQYLSRLFDRKITLPVLGRTLARTIGQNQVLLWSSDANTESLIASESYSGVISLHSCNAGLGLVDQCLAQTSLLSESVSTTSRQNPWTSRLVSHIINISSDRIGHEYQVDYKAKTKSVSASALTSTYHLYLPTPSTLEKVLLNSLPSSTKDVIKKIEGSFDHYEIPLSLISNQDNTVSIQATTPITDLLIPFSYSLTEYRQPGTIDSGTSLKITYPEGLRPTIVTSNFTAEQSQMKLSLPPHTTTFGFTLDRISE